MLFIQIYYVLFIIIGFFIKLFIQIFILISFWESDTEEYHLIVENIYPYQILHFPIFF